MCEEGEMTDSVFKVYKGSYLFGFGQPTVIVTADQSVKPTLYSEYFVFIEGENNYFWGGRISLDTNNAPEHIIRSEISTALDEALLQATTSMSLCQADHYKMNNIELWRREKMELEEKDPSYIARLWMSGKFNAQLGAIKERSKCQPLQQYIQLLGGIGLYQYNEF
jgi:hypothetical protein